MAERTQSSIAGRLKSWHGEAWHTPKGRIIRDIVYAIDAGLVTTVSFVAGASASLAVREKIILAGLIQIASGNRAVFSGKERVPGLVFIRGFGAFVSFYPGGGKDQVH